jgi:hypothetical protein
VRGVTEIGEIWGHCPAYSPQISTAWSVSGHHGHSAVARSEEGSLGSRIARAEPSMFHHSCASWLIYGPMVNYTSHFFGVVLSLL